MQSSSLPYMVWSSSQMVLPKALYSKNKTILKESRDIKGVQDILNRNLRKLMMEKMTNLSPEAIAIHVLVVVTKGCVCERPSFYIHVIQFSHVCSYNLICINKYYLHTNTVRGSKFIKQHKKQIQTE